MDRVHSWRIGSYSFSFDTIHFACRVSICYIIDRIIRNVVDRQVLCVHMMLVVLVIFKVST